MKCLELFHTEESACQCRDRLQAQGIETHIVVDPLACRYPALSEIQEVAVLVPDEQLARAQATLKQSTKAGSFDTPMDHFNKILLK